MILRLPICRFSIKKISARNLYVDIVTRRLYFDTFSRQLQKEPCRIQTCNKPLLPLVNDLKKRNGLNLTCSLQSNRTYCNQRPGVKKKPAHIAADNNSKPEISDASNVSKLLDKTGITQEPLVISPKNKITRKKKNKRRTDIELTTTPRTTLSPEEERIFRVFPVPKSSVYSSYQIFSNHIKKDLINEYTYESMGKDAYFNPVWKCKIYVDWPEERTFEATADSKSEAANRASLSLLGWLQYLGKLDRYGKPALVEKKDYFQSLHQPLAEIVISSENTNKIDGIINKYSEIEDIIRRNAENPPNFHMDKDMNWKNEVEFNLRDEQWYKERNAHLLARLKARESDTRLALPILPLKDKILQDIENNRVVVIKGETGCGKSSQVPQFILDHYIEMSKGTECNVVITQPRRISAISLAEWVASERRERLGESVGYHVRLSSVLPAKQSGSIVYVSTGILLRKIVNKPNLTEFSHVIIDEAHERDINIDLLLYLLKRAIRTNPNLRVIVMSATINAELFQRYYDDAPAVFVPGFMYPVQAHFFDHKMADMLGIKVPINFDDPLKPSVDVKLVTEMITWIHRNKPEGAILVFLPGWMEIRDVRESLRIFPDIHVTCAHSRLNKDEQKLIFRLPPPGKRKVVLATNIAETSITIDDVVYVVDTGSQKQERMEASGSTSFDLHWISQANVKQRQGRAGRTRPGESYHLFSKERFDTLSQFPKPEIHRTPLEKSVLVSKAYTHTYEKMAEFLSNLPEPPSYFAVQKAVGELQYMGALDSKEDLTPLGKRIYLFTLHPYLSKAVVYSVLFKCLNPVLTIATILSGDLELFLGVLQNKEIIRDTKKRYSPGSDHVALAWIYHQWEGVNPRESMSFCADMNLNARSLQTVASLRQLHRQYLLEQRMLSVTAKIDCFKFSSIENTHARQDELIKAVLLSGLNNLITVRKFHLFRGRLRMTPSFNTETGGLVQIAGESLNAKRSSFPVPFLTYYNSLMSVERGITMIRDTSLISPVSLLLFYSGEFTQKPSAGLPAGYVTKGLNVNNNGINRNPINIVGSSLHFEKLAQLKTIMWATMDYLIQHVGYSEGREEFEKVSQFRDDMLVVLSALLQEEGYKIDYNEKGQLRHR